MKQPEKPTAQFILEMNQTAPQATSEAKWHLVVDKKEQTCDKHSHLQADVIWVFVGELLL
ncbi:MAG TPA: hypothetical protein VNF46_07855 [Gammaproteobacteria bacterium]|nr:hypothetical protein [Gammaproteobacteria bacterium]